MDESWTRGNARRIRMDATRALSRREADRVLSLGRHGRRDRAAHVRGCPVRIECLEYALLHRIEHGVWGGASERERRRILRRRRDLRARRAPVRTLRDGHEREPRASSRRLPAERVDDHLREPLDAALVGCRDVVRERRRTRRPTRRPRTCRRHRRARRPTLRRPAARSAVRGRPLTSAATPPLGNRSHSRWPGCSNTETESTPSE